MDDEQDELKWEPSQEFQKIMDKKEVSMIDIREALLECFTTATGDDEIIAKTTLKKQFDKEEVSWDNPDKEGVIEVMDNLSDISKNFRSEKVIMENYNKMMRLIRDKIDGV